MRKQLFSLLLLGLLGSVGNVWGDAAYGFENNKTSESGYPTSAGDGSRSISNSVHRTGSYSLEQNNSNTSAKVVKIQNVSASFTGGSHYVHYIAYLKKTSSNSVTLSKHCMYAGSEFGIVTPSPATALTADWTRITNKAQRTGNSQKYTSVELRFTTQTATSGDKVYLDDIVVYVTSSDVPTDLTPPGQATEADASTAEITWTPGTDGSESGATGVQATLIFHRTGGSVGSEDLSLNNQGIYSLTSTEGPNVVGNWTLLSASVAADATSYSGTFVAGNEYAIVHRDLAYNYSTPTYIVAHSAIPTYAITLDDNGDYQGNGSATATEGSAVLTSITTPQRDGYSIEGYYEEAEYTHKIADVEGNLQANTDYTDEDGNWTSASATTLYAKWEAVELQNTTSSTTWAFGDTNITSGTKQPASTSTEYVYSSLSGMTFGSDFDATALSFKGSYAYYSNGGQHISQGSQWKFHPTVDGRVTVSWYSAGGAEDTRYLSVAGAAAGSTNNTKVTSDAIAVSANADVVIAGYSDESLETPAYIDVTEIAFTETPYTLTYDGNGNDGGSIPAPATKYAVGDEVTVLGNTGTLTKTGKIFMGWNTQADGLGTNYAADAALIIGTADVTLYAKWVPTCTLILDPNGGTISDATGWTLDNGKYKKVVGEGTEVTLPTFTKDGKTFSTWRNTSLSNVTSPVTITSNATLIAVWATVSENVLYSWIGSSSGATETGGTLAVSAGTDSNDELNVKSTTINGDYYVVKLQSKNDAKTGYSYITLSNALQEGDKIEISAFQNKNGSKTVTLKMIFYNGETQKGTIDEGNSTNWVNLYNDGPTESYHNGTEPQTKTFNVTSSLAGSKTIRIARSQSGTNLWISQIRIVRGSTSEDPITIPATINATYSWATFSSEYPLDFTDTDVEAYIVTGVETGNVLAKTRVYKVPANTGLLITGTSDDVPTTAASADAIDFTTNKMIPGTGAAVAKETGYDKYILSVEYDKAVFKIIDEDSPEVPTGKAYLKLASGSVSAPSLIRIVDEENNATNIQNVESNDNALKFIENGRLLIQKDGVVFDALGRKIR